MLYSFSDFNGDVRSTSYIITLGGGHVDEYEPLIKFKHFKLTPYKRYLIKPALDDVLNLRYLTATWY